MRRSFFLLLLLLLPLLGRRAAASIPSRNPVHCHCVIPLREGAADCGYLCGSNATNTNATDSAWCHDAANTGRPPSGPGYKTPPCCCWGRGCADLMPPAAAAALHRRLVHYVGCTNIVCEYGDYSSTFLGKALHSCSTAAEYESAFFVFKVAACCLASLVGVHSLVMYARGYRCRQGGRCILGCWWSKPSRLSEQRHLLAAAQS
jgi:hypothetical protein